MTTVDRATQSRVVELIRSGEADAAFAILNRHLQAEPRDWYALYMSGVALRALGRVDEAVARLTQATSVKSDEAPVHLALGIALQLSGRLNEAVRSLSVAIQLNPDLYEAYNSLGITYKKLGHHKDALDTYEQGVDRLMAGVSELVHSDPIRCYRDEVIEGKQVRTVLPYVFTKTRELLRSNPLYAILTNNVAVCYEEIGQIDEARRLYQEAIDCTPHGYNYADPRKGLQRLTDR
jgi:Flp pilus assembly protein TadD